MSYFHSCTPPLEMGCLVDECEPGVTDCGEGKSCEVCAAATCCLCAACVPACVATTPAQGPLPTYLKLRQTQGPAGQAQEILVEGSPFYIGALGYTAWIGDSDPLPEASHPSTCSAGFTIPARPPGMLPVWLSEYGGTERAVLAGFFTYSAGDYPSCVQPGQSCSAGQSCCQTADVPMACVSGRCHQH